MSRSREVHRPMQTLHRSRFPVPFLVLLLAYALYAIAFIVRTSFVLDGERYFSLFDDAMISMRYARNLAHGYGLVWNPHGERVEGYTNPLWVLYMSLVHLLPLAQSKVSLGIQVSNAVFLALNLVFVKKIAEFVARGAGTVSLGAVALTAFYLPLNTWSLQGMEVGILTLLVSVALWGALRCLATGAFSPWIYLLLGVGTLVRPDMAVVYGALGVFLAAMDRKNRQRHLLAGALILACFMLLQTALRLWYYGDILPNTYYLKMTGYPIALRIARGAYAALHFLGNMGLILLFLIPGTLHLRRNRALALLFWMVLVQIAYSIYVGGDAWEWTKGSNRYIALVMPSFFLLVAYALWQFHQLVRAALLPGREQHLLTRLHARYGVIVLFLFSFISSNQLYHLDAFARITLIEPPLYTRENETMVRMALALREMTTEEATIAVVWAGIIPYFSDRFAIDMLGKNDKVVAREPARRPEGVHPLLAFYPGHNKWKYSYSIGELRPDIIAQSWGAREELQPYLDTAYRQEMLRTGATVYVRKDSRNVVGE